MPSLDRSAVDETLVLYRKPCEGGGAAANFCTFVSDPRSSFSFVAPPQSSYFLRSKLAWLRLLLPLSVVLILPAAFVTLLIVLGWHLTWQFHYAVEDLTLGHGPAWWATTRLGLVALGFINCLLLFKPLLAGAPRRPSTRQLRAAGHPDLFELISDLTKLSCSVPPMEVLTDNSMSVRMEVRHGFSGWLSQDLVLIIGLPLAASCTVRELAGAICNQMGRNPAGIHGLLLQIFRGVNAWLDWAVCRRDPWEAALAHAAKVAPKRTARRMRLLHGFIWLTQRPVWGFMAVAKIASVGPLRRMVREADHFEALIVGSEHFAAALPERGRFERAWKEICLKVQSGIKAERLPDNLPLLAARFSKPAMSDRNSVDIAPEGSLFCPSDKVRIDLIRKLNLPPLVLGTADASCLFRDFIDLARQTTQFYYQQDLGLNIVLFRIVAAEEIVQQGLKVTQPLNSVVRYFRGLAHSDRVLCGLVAGSNSPVNLVALKKEIRECRVWMRETCDQMRALRHDWNMGWQRCRDLEMGHAFALARMPLDNHQYGVREHTPPLYREELERQAVSMEFTEESLVMYEKRLESRFTAALGLLSLTPVHRLPEVLHKRQAYLPDQTCLYVVLSMQMAEMRRLMTLFNAYQALGICHVDATENPSLLETLRYLTPRIGWFVFNALTSLRAMSCRPDLGPQVPCLAAYLAGMPAETAIGMLNQDWANLGLRPGLGILDAVRLGATVEHFVDAYFELYHHTFEWLAATAELSEIHLLDAEALEPSLAA